MIMVSRQIRYAVEGMHCSACAQMLQETLEEKEGVLVVDVSHEGSYADIQYELDIISASVILQAIAAEGYAVR